MTEPPGPGPQPRGALIGAALGVIGVAVAVVLVLVLTLLDRSTITAPTDLGAVSFGLPLPWITQSQSIDPPAFPWPARVLSPWENPTQVSLLPLAVDLVVVLAGLGALTLVVRRRARRP